MRIPQVRLDNKEIWDAIKPELEELVVEGRFVLGPELERFETLAAETFGSSWCVGTSSGTSALALTLKAALPPGSRVALPANTFYATFEAVLQAEHIPVLVDHGPDFTIDLNQLEDLELDAVIAVHLYGLPCDMTSLMKLAQSHGWFVLEDASQAHGASVGDRPVGCLGDAAAFSAYPTKNLGAWGDAGFVTGEDAELEAAIRRLRHHGQAERDQHALVGGTERLDNLQALVLTEKLRRLDGEVARRRTIALWYRDSLAGSGLDLPRDKGDRKHAYHQFVVRVPNRDTVRKHLSDRGIGTSVHYPIPIHLQPGAKDRFECPRPLLVSQAWAPDLLSLPMHAGLTQEDVGDVAENLLALL